MGMSYRQRMALEKRTFANDDRVEQLEELLKQAQYISSEAEAKYEEVCHCYCMCVSVNCLLHVEFFSFSVCYHRGRRALENRGNLDDDRIAMLEQMLKEATEAANDAEKKYDEVRFFFFPHTNGTAALVSLHYACWHRPCICVQSAHACLSHSVGGTLFGVQVWCTVYVLCTTVIWLLLLRTFSEVHRFWRRVMWQTPSTRWWQWHSCH